MWYYCNTHTHTGIVIHIIKPQLTKFEIRNRRENMNFTYLKKTAELHTGQIYKWIKSIIFVMFVAVWEANRHKWYVLVNISTQPRQIITTAICHYHLIRCMYMFPSLYRYPILKAINIDNNRMHKLAFESVINNCVQFTCMYIFISCPT